jgi:hypothetical protein
MTTSAPDQDPDVHEYRELLEVSSSRLQRQMRAAYVIGGFALCAVLTFLFTDKGPWHTFWSPFGAIADVLSMIALLPAVYTGAMAYVAWKLQKDAKREFREFLEDRYGVSQL